MVSDRTDCFESIVFFLAQLPFMKDLMQNKEVNNQENISGGAQLKIIVATFGLVALKEQK